MKLFDKITKKFANKASCAVKNEVKKTAIDLIPTILAFGSAIVGIFIFKGVVQNEPEPFMTRTNVTTNNYFFGDISEETIMKILEEADR